MQDSGFARNFDAGDVDSDAVGIWICRSNGQAFGSMGVGEQKFPLKGFCPKP